MKRLAPAMALMSAHALAQHSVRIENFTFNPPQVTVHVGEEVTWTNADDIPHTVTDGAATPPRYRSGPLDTGTSWTHRFTDIGIHRYFCSLHPHMQGMVVVVK